jgi:lambda repressor-like predicted transcriptional regulator
VRAGSWLVGEEFEVVTGDADLQQPQAPLIPNQQLRSRMTAAGLSVEAFAKKADVDRRTVERWLAGVAGPQLATARSAAAALECEPNDLWPDRFAILTPPGAGTVAVSVYASRADIPASVWSGHFAAAQHHIDIVVFGGTFLFDTVHGFNRLMTEAAGRGAVIRLAVGDPGSATVFRRGQEERIGDSLASRCRMTLQRLTPLHAVDGIHIRTHDTTLYASQFRVDDSLIANHHLYGSPASDNPMILLDRADHLDLWDTYTDSFERIWDTARPI